MSDDTMNPIRTYEDGYRDGKAAVKEEVAKALELLHQEYEHCGCEHEMCFIAAAIARNRASS